MRLANLAIPFAGLAVTALSVTALSACGAAVSGAPAAAPPTCGQLPAHTVATISIITEFSQDPKKLAAGGDATLERINKAKADLEADLATVPPAASPLIVTMAKTLKQLHDGIDQGKKVDLDLKAFREAGSKVTEVCK
ncbi:hypothetical protein [Pseudonocardia sp. TRM90224]|uniref:hypothetical protein n=1 Tax=Pseudonocardia sp. TRM90224 TaxID=2812678 RepID=UPI001E560247|nr:hypothetical protein [Pseudonocardia sp. TRM90224]